MPLHEIAIASRLQPTLRGAPPTKEATTMLKLIKKSTKKAGSAPGTLVHIGEKRDARIQITLTDYDTDGLQERKIEDIETVFPLKESHTKSWINVDGIHDVDLIQRLGTHFGIHPLTLEDILNTGQRPKVEEFEGYVFMVFKMLLYDSDREEVRAEQISLVMGEHYLMSFQEIPGDVFDPVRERIRKGKGRVRKAGCGYLAYALIDAVVDHYFSILEKIAEKIETLEDALLEDPDPQTLHQIHNMKRELIFMRKQIWPMREMVSSLAKGELSQIDSATDIFFKDVYDHCIQVSDTIESYRDVLSGMLDLYLSTASNRMNEVMKVLTIIATIFIPLTFLAGVYGMNFDFMPELHWKGSYIAFWAVIIVTAAALVIYFKRKKWL